MTTDGVRLALMTSRIDGVIKHMINTLFKTARSGVINNARDFSCCIVTHNDKVLSVGKSLPIHVMSGPELMSAEMKRLHPDFGPGDAFLHNSPYHGNSHAADHVMLVPVFGDGEHQFTVVAKAHQADCGNSMPTTYHAQARDVYEEGALLFSAAKVQSGYKECGDVLRMCEMRIRVPEQWRGDYLALLGAARIGERELIQLGREHSWPVLRQYAADWFDYSEKMMSEALRGLEPGAITTHTRHDAFPGVSDAIDLQASVAVDPDGPTVDVDLTSNPDCVPCGLNLTEATARTAAMVGVFNSIDRRVPKNSGSFRRVRVQLRENCVAGIPRHPASCSVATTNVADRITNVVGRAMAELNRGLGLAESGAVIPAAAAVVSGKDPRRGGAPFVNQMVRGMTGGGASAHADGWLTLVHAGSGGLTQFNSVEVDEVHHPLRILCHEIIPDTGGPGRFRGSSGALTEYGPVDCSMDVVFNSDGSETGAAGARGGGTGSLANQFKRRADGGLEPLPSSCRIELHPGETIVSRSCGGGGYGDPAERHPDQIAYDLREGYVTRDHAAAEYGWRDV